MTGFTGTAVGRALLRLLAVAGLWTAWGAMAASEQVFQGHLGDVATGKTASVVLELGEPDAQGVRQGRYFYVRHGVDIPLRGTLEALLEALPLPEVDALMADRSETSSEPPEGPVYLDPRTGKPRVTWSLKQDGTRLSGQWSDAATGKVLPVTLTLMRAGRHDDAPGGSGKAALAVTKARTPYDFLRMNVPLTPGPEVAQGGVAYRMMRDERTHIAYPRLTRHPDPARMAQANRLLEQQHWSLGLAALICASQRYTERGPAAGTLGAYDDEKVSVEYVSSTLMSVVESGSTYCGGAHPNNHFEPYTLDLLQGGYLDFSRIFRGYRMGQYVPSYPPALVRHVQQAASRKANADLDRQVARNGRKAQAEDVSEDLDCSAIWPSYLYVHFKAPAHLAFDVSGVGHAMGICLGTHVTLPFDQLKPWLSSKANVYLWPRP